MSNKNDNKEISVNAMDKFLEGSEYKENKVELDDTLSIWVRNILSYEDRMEFISDVVEACFYMDDYMPENFDPALRSATVKYFTNIRLPQDDSKKYKIIYHKYIVSAIRAHIDDDFYNECKRAIINKTAYRKDENIASQKRVLKEMMDQIGEYSNMTKNFSEQLKGEDLKSLFEAVAKLDELNKVKEAEKNLTEAVLEGAKKNAKQG